ncbi:MAG: AAA family ATPase [Nitrospira sp.]|nr:AAA family ATPase [Nitrospira sp.]
MTGLTPDNLILTVSHLSKNFHSPWIRLTELASKLLGTGGDAGVIASFAESPEYRPFFVVSGRALKLTDAGRERADTLISNPISITQRIVRAVREYANQLRSQSIRVGRSKTIGQGQHRVTHALTVEEILESSIPSETPVELHPDRGGRPEYSGIVVGQETDGQVLYVSFKKELDFFDIPGRLVINRAYFLHTLASRLEELTDVPSAFLELLNPTSHSHTALCGTNGLEVAKKLSEGHASWTRFLWGPPGGGKTFAIAQFLAWELQRTPTPRILLVAPSNRAVDVATEQLLDRLEVEHLSHLIAERRIMRYGYPRRPRILDCPQILGPTGLDALTSQISHIAEKIRTAEKAADSEESIAKWRAALLEIQEQLKNTTGQHLRDAAVVATTVALAYLPTSPISEGKWDIVVVDEVTMVPPAICAYLATMATKRFLLGGDPLQLGPVYEENKPLSKETKRWLGTDVFEAAGLSTEKEGRRIVSDSDTRMARITTQRRCAGDIWNSIRALYPNVMSSPQPAVNRLAALPPQPGEAVAIMDTSELHNGTGCEKIQKSWRNKNTAKVIMEFASTVLAEAEEDLTIAIISPYRAQVQLLQGWLRAEREGAAYFKHVDVGTVHQFQGSEADYVIFDMVDGNPRNSVGSLLRGDSGKRLVTVACTRARGKLVILADLSWCRRILLRESNPILADIAFERPPQPVRPPLDCQGESSRTECTSPIEIALLSSMREIPALSNVVHEYRIRNLDGIIVSRANFAFPEFKLAVYCDSAQWHLREDYWQSDIRLRNELQGLGWSFQVYTGQEILRAPQECATKIARRLQGLMK